MQSVTTSREKDGTTYKCVVCDREFKSAALGFVHYQSHYGKSLCSICNTFVPQADWKRHCAIEHDCLNYECCHCPFIYSRKTELARHVARKHTGPWFQCKRCERRYKSSQGYAMHKCKPFSQHVPAGIEDEPVAADSALAENPVDKAVTPKIVVMERGFPDEETFLPNQLENEVN